MLTGGSIALGIFGLHGFSFRSSLETERSATPCSLFFAFGVD